MEDEQVEEYDLPFPIICTEGKENDGRGRFGGNKTIAID